MATRSNTPKPTQNVAPAANATPAKKFDVGALSFDDAPVPTRTGGGRPKGPNPIVPVLKTSFEAETGKAVTVADAAAAFELIAVIRQAADELKIGSKIVTEPKLLPRIYHDTEGAKQLTVQPSGPVKVTFAGVPRKKFSKRTRADGTLRTDDQMATAEADLSASA